MILAEPLARLLLERGAFTPADTARAARMIACYSARVWAFCAVPVVVRGYYALGDRLTPVRIGAAVVALNFSLNLILIWPLAEAGLAVATSVAGMVQATVLVGVLSRRGTPVGWPLLAATALRTVAATAVMTAAGLAALAAIDPGPGLIGKLARVALPLAASAAVYFAAHAVMGGHDLRLALGHALEETA